jgi:hypothetical protein
VVRLPVESAPVALFDLLPLLVLFAGVGFRRRASAAPALPPIFLWVCLLLGVGLLAGATIGLLKGAESYQLLRVVRVEAGLLLTLIAVGLAGYCSEWRSALRLGLIAAGVAVALQSIVAFLWALLTGEVVWSAVGLPTDISGVTGQVAQGNVNVLRTGGLPSYLMLPALCLSLVRADRYRWVVASLILAASVVTLSRGFWVGTALAILTAAAYQAWFSRRPLFWIVSRVAFGASVLAAVVALSGNIVSTRVEQTASLTDDLKADVSALERLGETNSALAALTDSPVTFIGGVGSGVIIPYAAQEFTGYPGDVTSLLENSILARWTNLTIISLFGTLALLLLAFQYGVQAAARNTRLKDLGLMALALPALLIGSIVSQSLLSPIATFPFWLLAGTLILSASETRAERRGRSPVG